MLQGSTPAHGRTCLPQDVYFLADGAAGPGAEPGDGEACEAEGEPVVAAGAGVEPGDAEEALMDQKELNGWMISYRTSAPEKRPFSHWRKRFTKHRMRYSSVGLQPARSRRPMAEQQEMQKRWACYPSKKAKHAADGVYLFLFSMCSFAVRELVL